MLLEGQQIDHYRVARLLGTGAMGEVYLAEDPRVEQQVAIKVIRSEVSAYPDPQASQQATRLFQREAKVIARLDHPHILPLYSYGEQLLGSTPLLYLVMPYRQEGSLADWLRHRSQTGLLSPQQVAHFVRQAASALQYAHNHQVIHQDVKASNFLLRILPEQPLYPDLQLADFGIARLATATTSASQSIRGTPLAMAPEQWEGYPVPASDQYALAVMSYELLTGCLPFQGNLPQLMYQHRNVNPLPPSNHNQHLPSTVDIVLLHALAKQPEQRFAAISAFANAFGQAVQIVPEADASTVRAIPPPSANAGDIRAVLAISLAEAKRGTSRTLTLPGGRHVQVSVPPDVHDGFVLRLDRQGEVIGTNGSSGSLILTIMVKQEEDSLAISNPNIAEPTVRAVPTAEPESPAVTPVAVSDQSAVGSSGPRLTHTSDAAPVQPTAEASPASPVPTPTVSSREEAEPAVSAESSPESIAGTAGPVRSISSRRKPKSESEQKQKPESSEKKQQPAKKRVQRQQAEQQQAQPVPQSASGYQYKTAVPKAEQPPAQPVPQTITTANKQSPALAKLHEVPASPSLSSWKPTSPASEPSPSPAAPPPVAKATAPSVLPRRSERGYVVALVALVILSAASAVLWWLLYPHGVPPHCYYASCHVDRPRDNWSFVGTGVSAFVLLLAALVYSDLRVLSRLSREGITVQGRIIEHREKKEKNSTTYYVDYSYQVNGKTWEKRDTQVSEKYYKTLDKGASVWVCYLPEDPRTIRLIGETPDSDGVIAASFILLILAWLAYGMYLYMYYHY